jgi:hypothetical protein
LAEASPAAVRRQSIGLFGKEQQQGDTKDEQQDTIHDDWKRQYADCAFTVTITNILVMPATFMMIMAAVNLTTDFATLLLRQVHPFVPVLQTSF